MQFLGRMFTKCLRLKIVVHNFCEIHKEPVSCEEVDSAISYGEFQPDYLQCHLSEKDLNESHGKAVREHSLCT